MNIIALPIKCNIDRNMKILSKIIKNHNITFKQLLKVSSNKNDDQNLFVKNSCSFFKLNSVNFIALLNLT